MRKRIALKILNHRFERIDEFYKYWGNHPKLLSYGRKINFWKYATVPVRAFCVKNDVIETMSKEDFERWHKMDKEHERLYLDTFDKESEQWREQPGFRGKGRYDKKS